jgi:hypothetical protein
MPDRRIRFLRPRTTGDKRTVRSWMAWWYIAIAAGFALLTIDHILTHDRPWLVAVRAVIAAGFGFLGYTEFHTKRRKP